MIQYHLDLVLFFTLDYVRWGAVFNRSHWVETRVNIHRPEKQHMEDWVDLPTGGEH
jgi:hypothetical protein